MEQRKSYDKILKYSVTAKCTEPLHIGSASGAKEEVLVHPVDDIPFIQATSIAGVFRGYYEQTYGEEKAAELFGHRRFKEKTSNKNTEKDSEHESKIRFTDGKFLNNEKLVLNYGLESALISRWELVKKAVMKKQSVNLVISSIWSI